MEVTSLDPLDAHVESLYGGAMTGAATLRDQSIVGGFDGALGLLDPLESEPDTLRAVGPALLDAVELSVGGALLATDEGLLLYEDYLSDSPLSEALGGLALDLAVRDDALWIRAEDGLYRWRDGALDRVAWEGRALSGPMALGASVEGRPVIWASADEGAVALDVDSLEPLAWRDHGEVSGVAVDEGGLAWLVVDGALLALGEEGWTEWTLPEPLTGAWANPEVPGVWLGVEGGLVFLEDGAFSRVDGLPEGLEAACLSVDGLGRALLGGEAGLARLSARRVVAVVGLIDGETLDGELELTLLPTDPDAVTALSLTVDGEALTLEDGVALLDPLAHAGSEAPELAVSASWSDGETWSGALSFTVGAPSGVTWTEHIEPLYQESCARCHGGSTETVLDGRETWVERYEDILDEVESERMPLGGPPLISAQIALLRTWAEEGFAE